MRVITVKLSTHFTDVLVDRSELFLGVQRACSGPVILKKKNVVHLDVFEVVLKHVVGVQFRHSLVSTRKALRRRSAFLEDLVVAERFQGFRHTLRMDAVLRLSRDCNGTETDRMAPRYTMTTDN